MKNFISSILVIPLSSLALAGEPADDFNSYQRSSATWQTIKHHAPDFNRQLFKCRNAWGDKIKGRFTYDEKYLIELAGGQCRKARKRFNHHSADLSAIESTYFPVTNVYRAAEKIKREFGLKRSKLIKATRVKDSYKWFKYTLVFETRYHGIRKFRVKHRHWNGAIKEIVEV